MTTARYARWDGVGRPFTVVETDVPTGRDPGEVLVRIDVATVCGSDLHTVRRRRPPAGCCTLRPEQVGTVLTSGSPVRRVDGAPVTPGLRVAWLVTASCGRCERCLRDMPQKCANLRKYGHEPLNRDAPFTGGFASHCVLMPGTAIVACPGCPTSWRRQRLAPQQASCRRGRSGREDLAS